MAFTDNCSIFGALDEEGINFVVRHIMRQRPSLFNYGTRFVRDNLGLLCEKIDVHPWVIARANPIITVEDPLPILGSDGSVGVNFCFQITKAEIDFHPSGVFSLPNELDPPLKDQHFAFHVRVCGGLGCPSREFTYVVTDIADTTTTQRQKARGSNQPNFPERKEDEPKPPPKPIPTDKLDCFCIDVFATAHVEIVGSPGAERLVGKLDGLEIVDIEPKGLENSIECYLKLLIQLVLLPRLSVALKSLIFELLDGLVTITLSPTPVSGAVPHNPAVEGNKLKVFINMEVS